MCPVNLTPLCNNQADKHFCFLLPNCFLSLLPKAKLVQRPWSSQPVQAQLQGGLLCKAHGKVLLQKRGSMMQEGR